MVTTAKKHSWMSDVDPDFAPLIPGIETAFEKIWTFNNIDEFRGNWGTTRKNYADYVPKDGFSIKHQLIRLKSGVEVEIRLSRPSSVQDDKLLPVLYVLHGGGNMTFFSFHNQAANSP